MTLGDGPSRPIESPVRPIRPTDSVIRDCQVRPSAPSRGGLKKSSAQQLNRGGRAFVIDCSRLFSGADTRPDRSRTAPPASSASFIGLFRLLRGEKKRKTSDYWAGHSFTRPVPLNSTLFFSFARKWLLLFFALYSIEAEKERCFECL